MKKISLLQIIVSLAGAGICWYFCDQYVALSFLLGGVAILFSFLAWGIAMTLVFQKKFVALAIPIIVFKYAILGVIIYWLVRQGWVHLLWFAFGVASFAIAALLFAIFESLKEGKQDVI